MLRISSYKSGHFLVARHPSPDVASDRRPDYLYIRAPLGIVKSESHPCGHFTSGE